MAVTAYRLNCTDCDDRAVVAGEESRRDTDWVVDSLTGLRGTCPECNPTITETATADDSAETESAEEIELTALDSIGATAASNLADAGYDTVEAVRDASDEALLDVSWVGEKGLRALRERVGQLPTQQRWDEARGAR